MHNSKLKYFIVTNNKTNIYIAIGTGEGGSKAAEEKKINLDHRSLLK